MPECIRQVNAILAEDPRVLTLVTTGPSTPIDAFAIPYSAISSRLWVYCTPGDSYSGDSCVARPCTPPRARAR
jgi:hypothetical protein